MIEDYIQNGNCSYLITIMEKIAIDGSIKCDTKIALFSDIIGKIISSIEIRKFASKELTSALKVANSQI